MNSYLYPESNWPSALPQQHRSFLRTIINQAPKWEEIEGIAIGGSFISGKMDQYSDLDLIIIMNTEEEKAFETKSKIFIESLGSLLIAFTGEHVGVPNLYICLYDEPPLHVDLKFIVPGQLQKRVEDPIIIWDRKNKVHEALQLGKAKYPNPNWQWIEDRFWVWINYVVCKVGRGELFEAIASLSFLREKVLGPIALEQAHAQPCGVRRIEREANAFSKKMENTIARYESKDIIRALQECIYLYRELRKNAPQVLSQKKDVERYIEKFIIEFKENMDIESNTEKT
jgi:hypothetical protein